MASLDALTEAIASLRGRRQVCEALAALLAPLAGYDRRTGSDLARTLFVYVRSGGNLQATADRLFLHRNSVGYRLERIHDLAGLDLRDECTLRTLLVALSVTDPAALGRHPTDGGDDEDERS